MKEIEVNTLFKLLKKIKPLKIIVGKEVYKAIKNDKRFNQFDIEIYHNKIDTEKHIKFTEIKLTKEEKHILLHTLGLSNIKWYDKDKIKDPYRNRFYTSENTTDYPVIKSLIEKKLMKDTGQGCGPADQTNCRYFAATPNGIKIAQKIALNSIPKLSKSKKRYECRKKYGV